MSEQDMFPEIVEKVPVPAPAMCEYPYFIVAYWPRDRRWSVDSDMWRTPDDPKLQAEVRRKQECGWTHVTLMRLPSNLWEKA